MGVTLGASHELSMTHGACHEMVMTCVVCHEMEMTHGACHEMAMTCGACHEMAMTCGACHEMAMTCGACREMAMTQGKCHKNTSVTCDLSIKQHDAATSDAHFSDAEIVHHFWGSTVHVNGTPLLKQQSNQRFRLNIYC